MKVLLVMSHLPWDSGEVGGWNQCWLDGPFHELRKLICRAPFLSLKVVSNDFDVVISLHACCVHIHEFETIPPPSLGGESLGPRLPPPPPPPPPPAAAQWSCSNSVVSSIIVFNIVH